NEFDIHCRDAATTGRRLRQRVCRPQFADTATGRAAAAMMRFVLYECPPARGPGWEACFNRSMSVAQGHVAHVTLKERQLGTEIERIARENADFRKAIAEYRVVERRYQDARRGETVPTRASVTILDTGARRRRGITPPRPVDLSTSAALAAREGWVKLRYSVRADGATADVRVVDAMPLGLDPSRAVAAATAWR